MKKYNSPICEIKILFTSDIITESSYDSIVYSESGNLDNGGFTDKIYW